MKTLYIEIFEGGVGYPYTLTNGKFERVKQDFTKRDWDFCDKMGVLSKYYKYSPIDPEFYPERLVNLLKNYDEIIVCEEGEFYYHKPEEFIFIQPINKGDENYEN